MAKILLLFVLWLAVSGDGKTSRLSDFLALSVKK